MNRIVVATTIAALLWLCSCASLTSYGCKSECEPNPVAQATATKCTCQPGSPRYGEGKYIVVNEELERERIEEGEDIAPSGPAAFVCPGRRRLVAFAGTQPICIAEDR
jgi:hypothetical protein